MPDYFRLAGLAAKHNHHTRTAVHQHLGPVHTLLAHWGLTPGESSAVIVVALVLMIVGLITGIASIRRTAAS